MKILCFSKVSPVAPQVGGAELRTWECARRWAADGHHVAIVSGRTSANEVLGHRVVEGVDIHVVRTLPTVAFRMKRLSYWVSRAMSYAQSIVFRPGGDWDVVRDDVSPFPSAYPLHARRLGIPGVLVVHILFGAARGWIDVYGPIGAVGSVGEAAIRRGVIPSVRVVSASDWLVPQLATSARVDPIWIPNGVDGRRFRPSDQPRPDGPVRFLVVGRFGPLPKGQADVVRALAKLPAEFEVTFAGDGPELSATVRLARDLGVGERCIFLGNVPTEEMPQLYRRHDAFVLSSYSEGLPLTYLEAMASGLPIVSTDILATASLTPVSQALTFSPGDITSLANHLQLLAADPVLRQSMGRASRAGALARFTWDETARRELEVMHAASASHGG